VQGCFFQAISALLPPYANLLPQNGIIINNCKLINIGGNSAGLGNYFENIQNGIYINSTMNDFGAYIINLLYNKFENILGGPNLYDTYLWDVYDPNVNPTIYSSSKGCAIFAKNRYKAKFVPKITLSCSINCSIIILVL
jgi:hypothetical protein